MSGVVRIEIVETPEELKDLMRQEKDVLRHEKLQVLYWLKTQTVDSVLSAAVRLGKHRGCISLLRMCQKKVKMKKLVKSSNKDEVNKMTPSDQQQLKAHLKAAAKILYRNTDPTELKSFESIEKSVRQKMLSEVSPEIGNFFFQQYQEFKQENHEK